MATRGVFQLKNLGLYYCEVGGSSRAMREYLGNGKLIEWATPRPHINIDVIRRNGHHPYVHANYLSEGRTMHQVSVKNYESWEEIEQVLEMLSNRSGRRITKIVKPVLTDTPSIQGVWTPFLNLQHEPPFTVQIVEGSAQDSSATATTHDGESALEEGAIATS